MKLKFFIDIESHRDELIHENSLATTVSVSEVSSLSSKTSAPETSRVSAENLVRVNFVHLLYRFYGI
jgi:hypothetical protein